ELALEPGTSPAFTLDLAGLPLAPGVALPSGTATVSPGEPPIVLPPQTRAFFRVTYTPTEVTDSWTTAQFVPEHGGIRVASNVPPGSVRVPISGPAIKPICSIPTEVVVIEGPDVDPDSLVHLRAISALQCASFSPLFAWSVRRPGSSVRTYLPGFSGDAATFKVTEPGDYLFRVEVLDSTGKTHCEADATVRARIGSDIRIDLTWTTPGDPDPTDNGPQASADLDLHFAHPWAEGEDLDGNGVFDGWFDLLYDCFWFNPNPNWGSPDPAFSKGPHLLGDSESGSVSEVVRMFPHDEALEYKVGVHAWNDNGFGGSLATVRVRIGGAVVFEAAEVPLEPLAMWEVATIKWPSGAVTPLTDVFGKPRILPHYDPAIFPGP
ncbi:MAG: hypothetical protein R3F39_26075, partial [Myxococcota bacterium]